MADQNTLKRAVVAIVLPPPLVGGDIRAKARMGEGCSLYHPPPEVIAGAITSPSPVKGEGMKWPPLDDQSQIAKVADWDLTI